MSACIKVALYIVIQINNFIYINLLFRALFFLGGGVRYMNTQLFSLFEVLSPALILGISNTLSEVLQEFCTVLEILNP